jgi:hypothetical protein
MSDVHGRTYKSQGIVLTGAYWLMTDSILLAQYTCINNNDDRDNSTEFCGLDIPQSNTSSLMRVIKLLNPSHSIIVTVIHTILGLILSFQFVK